MANTDAQPRDWAEVFAAWTAPIDRDTAAHEVKQISKAWMTLALVQLVIALYCYLLPSIPVMLLSGMPLQHVLYAPALFILGLLYGAFPKWRIVSRVIAVVFIVAILGEAYFYVTDHIDMIAADRNYSSLVFAAVWRLALLWLSLRGLKAALLAR